MPDESLIANKREFYKSTWGHINHMLISESFFMVTWTSYECPDRIIGYAAIWKGRKLIKPKGYSEHKESNSSLSLTKKLNATELKMTISPIFVSWLLDSPGYYQFHLLIWNMTRVWEEESIISLKIFFPLIILCQLCWVLVHQLKWKD